MLSGEVILDFGWQQLLISNWRMDGDGDKQETNERRSFPEILSKSKSKSSSKSKPSPDTHGKRNLDAGFGQGIGKESTNWETIIPRGNYFINLMPSLISLSVNKPIKVGCRVLGGVNAEATGAQAKRPVKVFQPICRENRKRHISGCDRWWSYMSWSVSAGKHISILSGQVTLCSAAGKYGKPW